MVDNGSTAFDQRIAHIRAYIYNANDGGARFHINFVGDLVVNAFPDPMPTTSPTVNNKTYVRTTRETIIKYCKQFFTLKYCSGLGIARRREDFSWCKYSGEGVGERGGERNGERTK